MTGEPLPDEKINVNVAVQFHDDGQVSLTFGPVNPEDVPDMLASIGTEEFADQFIASLRNARSKGAE